MLDSFVGFDGCTATIDHGDRSYCISIDTESLGPRREKPTMVSVWDTHDELISSEGFNTFGEAYIWVLNELVAQGGTISLDDTVSLKCWAATIEVK